MGRILIVDSWVSGGIGLFSEHLLSAQENPCGGWKMDSGVCIWRNEWFIGGVREMVYFEKGRVSDVLV